MWPWLGLIHLHVKKKARMFLPFPDQTRSSEPIFVQSTKLLLANLTIPSSTIPGIHALAATSEGRPGLPIQPAIFHRVDRNGKAEAQNPPAGPDDARASRVASSWLRRRHPPIDRREHHRGLGAGLGIERGGVVAVPQRREECIGHTPPDEIRSESDGIASRRRREDGALQLARGEEGSA